MEANIVSYETRGKLHLRLINEDFQPAHHHTQDDSESLYGCDFNWSNDFNAYRCLPIRWVDDASYANWQARDIDDREHEIARDLSVDFEYDDAKPVLADDVPF